LYWELLRSVNSNLVVIFDTLCSSWLPSLSFGCLYSSLLMWVYHLDISCFTLLYCVIYTLVLSMYVAVWHCGVASFLSSNSFFSTLRICHELSLCSYCWAVNTAVTAYPMYCILFSVCNLSHLIPVLFCCHLIQIHSAAPSVFSSQLSAFRGCLECWNVGIALIEYIFFNGSTAPWGPRPPQFSRLHDHTF
jgi:hypothetical protein